MKLCFDGRKHHNHGPPPGEEWVRLDHPKQQGLKILYIVNVGDLYVHLCYDLVHARSMTSLPSKILAYITI